jgi:hypothetical protein
MDKILDTIFNEIQTISLDEPVFIYTGVGSAASLNAEGILEQQNYHQFPPFLQNLKNTIPNLHLFIILIDPYLEEPPYMVKDKGIRILNDNECENNSYCNSASETSGCNAMASGCNAMASGCSETRGCNAMAAMASGCSETSGCNAMAAMAAYRKSIYTNAYLENGENITNQLRRLNKYAIQNNITTLYHDFTGRDNKLLAEFFDLELGEDLDHIVYGMSARENHDCYFDLTELTSFFPYRITSDANKRPLIRLFNIYKYITLDYISEKLDVQYTLYPQAMHPMIDAQKEQVIIRVKNEFKNSNFSILRVIKRLITGLDTYEEITNMYWFEPLPPRIKNKSLDLYHKKEFIHLFSFLLDYFAKSIELVLKIKNIDLTGREILDIVTDDVKIYNWYDNLSQFF